MFYLMQEQSKFFVLQNHQSYFLVDENMKFGVYKPAKSNITSEVFFCNAFDKWAAPTSLIPFPFERLAMATT